jgi:hypothetical protein
MDGSKWSVFLLGLASIATAGCCNQPCSWGNWGGGNTYAPPTQPVYQQSYPAPVYGAPAGAAPVYSAPVSPPPAATVPTSPPMR